VYFSLRQRLRAAVYSEFKISSAGSNYVAYCFGDTFTVLLAFFAVRTWKQHLELRAYINKLPGTNGLPILGHALEFSDDTYSKFT